VLPNVLEIAALLFIGLGVAFCALGVLGMVRFNNVFIRLHAGGLISTLGLGGIVVGGALIMPSVALKLIVLLVFVVLTAPAATHAIALAALRTMSEDSAGADAGPRARFRFLRRS